MNPSRILAAAGLLLLAAACGRTPDVALGDLRGAPRAPATMTVLRIPQDGGPARLYRTPGLDSAGWKAADKLPPVGRVIGADAEQGLVFMLDRKQSVVALDLDTRRVRTYLDQVRSAAIGPDGALYAVDTGSAVTQLVRRTPVRFRSKLQGQPRELHATMQGTVLARVGSRRPVLEVLGSDQQPASIPIADGAMAPTYLGDLVAVAADTAVVLYSSDPKRQPLSIPVSGHARAAVFSPSGHRIYVARERNDLLVIDRFGHGVLTEIDLPGPARDLRGDFYGRWLLARAEGADSVWVIDMGTERYVGAVAARWGRDLPAVASPSTLLVRRGKDVVALDLADKDFPETGRVEGGAADLWLPVGWHPEGEPELSPELPSEADTAALDSAAVDSAGPSQQPAVYLQVSSSQNPAWANELAAKLRAAELPASVLPPKRPDEAYRVVLGPYATREQAEATGRDIGMPSFVIMTQDE